MEASSHNRHNSINFVKPNNSGMKQIYFHAERKIMEYLKFENLLAGWFALLLNTIFPFLFPIREFLILTIALVACDTITGIMAAKRRKEPITSRGIRRTVEKITAYFIAILCAEGMRVTFIPEISIPYFVAFIIAIAEFKSNIENVEHISGINIWQQIMDKFKINK